MFSFARACSIRLIACAAVAAFVACTEPAADPSPEAAAHQVAEIPLGESEAVPGEFTRIVGVRELSDGRLLVADAGVSELHLLRPGVGETELVGGTGDGPGEYRGVAALFRLAGDSSAIYDGRAGRLLMLEGETVLDHSVRTSSNVVGADERARWLLAAPQGSAARAGPGDTRRSVDSLLIIRASPDLAAADTVAHLQSGEVVSATSDGVIRRITNTLTPSDRALLFADGWIALAFADPYRVDWIAPDGRRIHGEQIPSEPVPLDRAEIEARIPAPHRDLLEFPDHLPAFLPPTPPIPGHPWKMLAHAPDGRLLVRRAMPAGSPRVRYDLIDREGALAGYLLLEENEQIVGAGEGTLYVATTDAVGLQRLRVASWSAGPALSPS